MDIYGVLTDFAIASVLILIGQLIRSKVRFFQKFFIPASMIAGFLGLFLGQRFLKVISFSDAAGEYTSLLILIIYAVIGINGFSGGTGKGQGRETFERIVGFSCYRFALCMLQYAIGIAAGISIIKWLVPGISDGFGLLLAAGFNGGHGTAAAVAKTFSNLGWTEAGDLGMTMATIGILVGVFGGLAQIKLATKKGWTGYIKDFSYVSGDLKTGLVSPENMKPMGNDTISSVSLDSLCYHLSLILMVTGGGYALNTFVIRPYISSSIPDYTIIFCVALLFFLLMRKTGIYKHMDKRVNSRVAGTCTDYLVFFGIARVNTSVVLQYALPIILLTLAGFFALLVTFWLGYKMVKKSWFEHYLFCYGYNTGIFAIGFVLLRIVDPDNKSLTLEDVALSPWSSFIDIFSWSLIPIALLSGRGWTVVAVCLALTVVPVILSIVCKAWYNDPLNKRGFYGVEEPTD
ncbi:MAG: sodium:glutamate symporter [Oscillospiraceae bacterium]|nr:sodium:glutamate symporter [Oscillospiraceae bacterium]